MTIIQLLTSSPHYTRVRILFARNEVGAFDIHGKLWKLHCGQADLVKVNLD